jgi:hypothetical protein
MSPADDRPFILKWSRTSPESQSFLLGQLPSTEQSVAGGTTVTGPAHEGRRPRRSLHQRVIDFDCDIPWQREKGMGDATEEGDRA